MSVWHPSPDSNVDGSSAEITSVCQPDSPATKDNLLDEVKNIYASVARRQKPQGGLMNKIHLIHERVNTQENLCMDFHDFFLPNQILTKQMCKDRLEAQKDLIQAYLAYFLACQHPLTTEDIAALPQGYGMEQRLLQYGIHGLLELMRNQSELAEDKLHFLDIAQATMTFLYQMVSQFEVTWMECLGELAGQRSAIMKKDEYCDEWTDEARLWYNKLLNKTPSVGRLYCCLATISRYDAMQQLFYFHLSLHVTDPFAVPVHMWESLFARAEHEDLHPSDAAFISIYHILFYKGSIDRLSSSTSMFLDSVEKRVAEMGEDWRHIG